MHRVTFLVFIASVFALCFLGCSKPKPPTLTPETTSITSVTPQGVGVRVTLAAYNPNDFALTTQKVSAKIVLGNKVTLGPIEKPHGVSLPANSTTKVTFELDATWAQAKQLALLATGGPTVPYEVDGTMAIGGKTLNVDLPFKLKGEVSQAQLIAAGLNGLKLPGFPVIR